MVSLNAPGIPRPQPRTIKQEWESFRAAVLPAEAPAHQVKCMREAFYSGAVAMRSQQLIAEGVFGGAMGDRHLANIDGEFEAYNAAIQAQAGG